MYEELAKIPVPNAAEFSNTCRDRLGPTTIQVCYSVTDFTRNVKRQMFRYLTVPLSSETSAIPPTSVPTHLQWQDTGTVLQRNSSSGKKRAVLRKVSNGNGDPSVSRIVEVWEDGLLEVSLNVTDLHGDFYADESFGSLEFAPSELALVYVAELKSPDKDDNDPYRKYRFNPDFGEGFVGKVNPAIFLLRWSPSSSPNLFRLNAVGFEDVLFGQPIFDPRNSNALYVTGYELTADGRVLGIKFCFNRPTGIWKLTIPKLSPNDDGEKRTTIDIETTQKLTPSHLSCRSPRVLDTGERSLLIWLACACGGAHASTTTLHMLDITLASDKIDGKLLTAAETPLVGLVQEPLENTSAFPGLYPSYNLLSSPFIYHGHDSDRQHKVLLSSQWGSRKTILQVSLKDGNVWEVTPSTDEKHYSWSLLATDGVENFVCSRSAPDVPYEVLLGRFRRDDEIDWVLLDKPNLRKNVAEALDLIKTTVVSIKDRGPLETIIVQSESSAKSKIIPPCVSVIHGGPHGGSTTAFVPTTTALAIEGYTVSLPNYTGSTGYGEAFLQRLIGRCGDLDVADCIATAKHLTTLGISEEGRGKQLIMGGSHGGFLGAHLAGRFSSFFSAAVLRNPVISVGEMSATDIPDWYYSEFGMKYPLSSIPIAPTLPCSIPPLMTTEVFDRLRSLSPILHVDQVSIPILLVIGKVDRRVAPSQGIDYYHALKARKKRVEMLRFEGESHALDGVEAAKISFEAAIDWFAQATK